jgi:hypothetical protein
MHRTALAGMFLLAFASHASATTVVAAWTPTTLVLGADSLTHTLDEDKYWSICKINVSGDVFWAAAGATANPAMNYSIGALVDKAMSGTGSLDVRIAAFEAALIPALAEVANAIRTENPSWYDRHAEGLALTRVLFDAFEDGANHLRLREFVTRANPSADRVDVSVTRTDCPGPACPDSRIFFLGQYEFASKAAGDLPMSPATKLAEGVRRSIEAEIAHNPGHVGPPVSIVEITKDGANWIDKGECGASARQ